MTKRIAAESEVKNGQTYWQIVDYDEECVLAELGCSQEAEALAEEIVKRWDNSTRYKADADRLAEALTPSAYTKAAYSCEFSFTIPDSDEDGEECRRTITVPWTTIKEIMAAIKARAALSAHERSEW